MNIGYCRLSKDHDAAQLGIERQRDAINRMAAANGQSITHWLVDEDVSASAYARRKRDGFEQLVTWLEADLVTAVYASHQDRLVRKLGDLERLLNVSDSVPITMAGATAPLDTAEGRAMARIGCTFAAMDMDNMSRRSTDTHKQHAELGKWPGGTPPFAYELVDKRLVLDRDKACQVRKLASQVMDEEISIAEAGRQLGLSANTFRRALKGATWAGLRELDGETYIADWDPIFTPEERDEIVAWCDARTRGWEPAKLLTGFLTCGKCGGRVRHAPRYLKSRDETIGIYECREAGCWGTSAHADPLEDAAFEAVVVALGPHGATTWSIGSTAQRRELLKAIDYSAEIPVRQSGAGSEAA